MSDQPTNGTRLSPIAEAQIEEIRNAADGIMAAAKVIEEMLTQRALLETPDWCASDVHISGLATGIVELGRGISMTAEEIEKAAGGAS